MDSDARYHEDLHRLLQQRSAAVRRSIRREVFFRRIGRFMPAPLKRGLARLSPLFGLLFAADADVLCEGYLGRFRFWLRSNSSTERAMLANRFEPETVAAIGRFVQAGDICFDIGANVGALALPMGARVGPGGAVHCFEPGPRFFERLTANVALNPELAPAMHLHRLGLSDRDGSLNWAEDPDFPGNATLLLDDGVPVPVTTVDRFVAEHQIPRLDFMKIDVEGMEIEILNGALKTLQTHRPKIIFETIMEFEVMRNRPIRKDVEDLLLGLGYEIYDLNDLDLRHPVRYPRLMQNCIAILQPASR